MVYNVIMNDKGKINVMIGGLQKLSLVDYPGKTAAGIFTIGCNMFCGFCHNPELVDSKQFVPEISHDVIFDFLEKRRGLLDGVVISGGEPTLHKGLPELAKKIKKMGFLIKLDSQGTNPEMIKKLWEQNTLDFVAMDIKSSLSRYETVAQRPVDIEKVKQSIEFIKNCGVDYEFRTTVIDEIHTLDDMREIAETLNGAKRYAFQRFRPGVVLNPEYHNYHPYNDAKIEKVREFFKGKVDTFVVH